MSARQEAGTGAERATAPAAQPRLPAGIMIATAWSWRLLVISAAVAVIVFVIIGLRIIVIPVMVAVLVCALLVPFVDFLHARSWPRWLAIITAMIALIVIVGALIFVAVWQIRGEFHTLERETVAAFTQFRDWLSQPPLSLTDAQISSYLAALGKAAQQDSQVLIRGAVSIGSSVGHFAVGLLLTLFATLFILIDGRGIWEWIVRLFPLRARAAVDGAGRTGWSTLTNFARVQILVALIDAIGIGLGALILGIPLVAPIAILVFLGSFIPIVGAIVTGAVACVVALVYNGWVIALIMLGVVLLVHQVEGHVLQPLIMGTAVKVHPLAVVLVVAAGSLLAGIPGALFAVPVAAVFNVMVRYIAGGTWKKAPPGTYAGVETPLWRTVPRPRRRHD